MHGSVRILAALAILAIAAPAAAQVRRPPPKKPARILFSISGGVQPSAASLDDAFDLALYTDKEPVTVEYPSKAGVLVAASAGYRIWRQFVIGLGVTRSSSSGDANVAAELPHPFLDNTFRHVEGTAPASRDETGAHLMFGYLLPLGNRLRVLLTAGPSFLSVEQTVVTEVTFSEAYPYDTAVFTGVKSSKQSDSGTGFNAGADVAWMFTRTFGVGGLAQFTRARVRMDAGGGRSISFDAGGAQVGAGVRFAF